MGQTHIQTRVPDELADRIKEYQESGDFMNRAEALRSLLRAGLDTNEESDLIEDHDTNEIATDGGGYWLLSDHPWIDPIITIADRAALYGMVLLSLGIFAILVPGGAIAWFGADLPPETAALFLSLFSLLALFGFLMTGIAVIGMLALEYLMHPAEAPIRRYFPRTWPDTTPEGMTT